MCTANESLFRIVHCMQAFRSMCLLFLRPAAKRRGDAPLVRRIPENEKRKGRLAASVFVHQRGRLSCAPAVGQAARPPSPPRRTMVIIDRPKRHKKRGPRSFGTPVCHCSMRPNSALMAAAMLVVAKRGARFAAQHIAAGRSENFVGHRIGDR